MDNIQQWQAICTGCGFKATSDNLRYVSSTVDGSGMNRWSVEESARIHKAMTGHRLWIVGEITKLGVTACKGPGRRAVGQLV